MEILPIIYFAYMFVALYFLFLTLVLYFKNKNQLFEDPVKTKDYSVSILVPAYNEEKTIANTIEHIFNINYKNILEVFVINDGSTDNTLEILKKLLPKYKHHKTKLTILNKKNSGKADSLNKALKFAKGELVVVTDADSYPSPESFNRLVGFFDDPKVGGATVTCFVRNQHSFLEKLQAIEYRVIAFTRKLLEYVESIYVVPGPCGMYRRTALEDIGGFDTNNITEDIEATWHLLHEGWRVRMSLNSKASTTVPNKFKPWYTQRRRWALGGLQCLNKYKSDFMHKGMLGLFVVPFFTLGYMLGLVGFGIFGYVIGKRILREYLIAKYSVDVGVPILTMNEVFITPSVLNYFGIVLFVLFVLFNLFVLSIIKDKIVERQSFFNLFFYMTIYLLVYPLVLITGIWHFIRGKQVWR